MAMTIKEVRDFLGPTCDAGDVAACLGLRKWQVLRSISVTEIQEWANTLRMAHHSQLGLAVKKIRRAYLIRGRRPTARESGVHSSVMTSCGGFLAILEASNLPK